VKRGSFALAQALFITCLALAMGMIRSLGVGGFLARF
jgi:hypothetical protein